ncbi:MAG: DUF932 domain-containing protein [Flavobacteriaceae bacterium]|nr:DUF932 domain-containing protein [Flavobacteriaceae bacterium]
MNTEENNNIAPRKSVNLSICGGNHSLVSIEQVASVPTPPVEYRKKENAQGVRNISYQPVAHHDVVNRTRDSLAKGGFTIQDEVHSLARDDKHYFGLFAVDHPNRVATDRGCVVGVRNSHDKTFPAGLCAGDAPFVCDNLIFTNTIKLARRHTRNILQDLDFTINRALGKLFGFWHGQDARIEAYKNRTIGEVYAHDLIIRATKAGALPKSKIIDVVNQWESSDHPEFWDRNVNSLYNAFTEVYKGNLVQLPNRSDALHSVFDNFVDFKIDDHVENTLDMEVVEGELVEV